jgi:chromosome segregation ATPase
MFPENHVKDLRNEAAKYRTERNELAQRMEAFESEQKAMVQNLAKALGLADAEAEKSPDDIIAEIAAERDKFASERDDYQQRLAEFRRTEAIRAAAKQADADADILLDSRTFTDKVQALDTDDDNYSALVADLVADAVNTNPRYKATPAVPTTSGSDPQKSAAPAEAPSGPAAWHAKRFPKK